MNLVGLCSFSECTKAYRVCTLLAVIQYFVSDSSHVHYSIACVHVHTIALAVGLCTQNVATLTIMLNFRDQKSNHEIHENMELYGTPRMHSRAIESKQTTYTPILSF